MRLLFLTSCTGQKAYKIDNQLTWDDFRLLDTEALWQKEESLDAFRLPARDMYTGQQHVRLLRGLDALRKACPYIRVDLKIISAGYGLIDENVPIVPYEMSFNMLKAKALREWADSLKLPYWVLSVMAVYDLTIFLLGEKYLRAVNLPPKLEIPGACVFLTGKGSRSYLPSGPNVQTILLANEDAKRLGAGLVALKGRVVEILGEHVSREPEFLGRMISSPELLTKFIRNYGSKDVKEAETKPKNKKGTESPTEKLSEEDLTADYDSRVIRLSEEWLHSSHRKKIRYFIPEWDDLVNPKYDFEHDVHPEGTGDAYQFGHYAHQLYDSPPYDGILVSKIVVEMKKSKKAILEKLGVHRYLRVPRAFPVMGDCGAFGYIAEDTPPYETGEILDYYQRLDFDYGVSIDHLIVQGILKRHHYYVIDENGKRPISEETFNELKDSEAAKQISSTKRKPGLFDQGTCICREESMDEKKRDFRYELTINNARNFIEMHREGGYRFTPIGAVQGWSPESYADAVREYQQMGYTYLALGGLVRTQTKEILKILEAVHRVLKPGVDLHLFGVARPDGLRAMQRLGITSIDSASFLRRAWLGASSNYFTAGEKYAAIRIPQAEKSPRAKKMVREGKISLDDIKKLESKCLKFLRAYDRNESEIDDVFEAIMTYDDLMGGNRNDHDRLIRKTLEDRPWQSCTCKICREKGVEVIIFRGNNRNRRRGFHNTKVFYDQLRQIFGDP